MADYRTYQKLCRFLEERKFLTEAISKAFVGSFLDVLFEMVTVDGELRLFDALTFTVKDKIAYVKTSPDVLELVRHASYTVELNTQTCRTVFSEAVRAYDFVIADATAMALRSVNSITGKEERLGFDEVSREAVLDSLPTPADIVQRSILADTRNRNTSGPAPALMKQGFAFTQGAQVTNGAQVTQGAQAGEASDGQATTNREPIYTNGVDAVQKKFHSLQAKIVLNKPEVLSFMRCLVEGMIGLLAKYSEMDLGVMGKLNAYKNEAVEIRVRSCTLPIALPRGLTVKWIPSHRLISDAQYKSKHEIRRKHYINLSDEEKIWINLKQLLAKAEVSEKVIVPEPDATPDILDL